MKKTILLITLTALLCSCAERVETAPAETTTLAPETTPPTETTPADRGERIEVGVASFYYAQVDPALLNFYKDEAEEQNGLYCFDYAYAFKSSVYDDSDLHPERFSIESYQYTPAEEYQAAAPFELRAGDTVGGCRIKAANTLIAPTDMGYGENTILENSFDLDGEYTFTGVLRFFYEEDYMIGAGDLQFTPAEPLTDFPVPLGFAATPSFFNDFAVYSELMNGFRVGNLFTGEEWGQSTFDTETGERVSAKIDENVLKELERMFAGETDYCERRVTVTLKDVSLSYSEQFGAGRCTASIAAIEEI